MQLLCFSTLAKSRKEQQEEALLVYISFGKLLITSAKAAKFYIKRVYIHTQNRYNAY